MKRILTALFTLAALLWAAPHRLSAGAPASVPAAADCASSVVVLSAFSYSDGCAQATLALNSPGRACVDIEAKRGSAVVSILSGYYLSGSATLVVTWCHSSINGNWSIRALACSTPNGSFLSAGRRRSPTIVCICIWI